MSVVNAFGTIRLGGVNVTTSGANRIKIGASDATMLISDSGAFTSAAVVQNTGQTLYGYITQLSGAEDAKISTLTTNLITSGQQLVATGNFISFMTGVFTGVDFQFVSFNYTFSTVPRVNVQFDMNSLNNVAYFVAVTGRATNGFWACYSDQVSETGNQLSVLARN